jgi:anti-sigma factor RsiW
MNHLGQKLSALIDGELTGAERDQVLWHLVRCGWCQEEAAALRALKQRMNALREAAAGAGLNDRLMYLNADGDGSWPQPASGWQFGAQPAQPARPEARTGRYLLASSVALFLAGLGTAAFIAGGEPQVGAPAPQVTPQVGIFTVEHDNMNGLYMNELTQRRQPQSAGVSFGQDQSAPRRQP